MKKFFKLILCFSIMLFAVLAVNAEDEVNLNSLD